MSGSRFDSHLHSRGLAVPGVPRYHSIMRHPALSTRRATKPAGNRRRVRRGTPLRRTRFTVAAFALVFALSACGSGDTAIGRGDRLWADSSYNEALAEYILAYRQGGDNAALARAAHAHARLNDLEGMRDTYAQLLERAPEYADQAVYDYLQFAHRSHARDDRYGLASAIEAALAIRPDLPIGELAAPLARYYANTGNIERALFFFEKALIESPDEANAEFLYEIGLAHERRGRCQDAIGFFTAYRERESTGQNAVDARWHTGNCAFELGRAARQAGQPTQALHYLSIVLDLGVPENVQDQAWYEHGEVLFGLGRGDEALFSYQQVVRLNPARTGQLVQAALRRIDQIRFGF